MERTPAPGAGRRSNPPYDVAVVVPVYDPGRFIEPLIASLAAQSLPPTRFQAIFVDDGSTDDTPARLDRLAADWPNVTVVHQPNSGWPGRPRNVGLALAEAEYVQFVDQDDWLGEEALERLVRFGRSNGSDVVIGRQAGHHRRVAKELFERTLPAATLLNAPLMSSLTPHAMFRKGFLDEHGLRFPEGRRRLEDHVFVTRAYLLAERVSILADYHCYFHIRRPDSGNAAYQRIDPAGYYANVREVAEVVLAHTEPGWVRDESLRRSLRLEVLGRLDGRQFAEQDEEFLREVFEAGRCVVIDTMAPSVDAGLPSTLRVRAGLLRDGRFDDTRTYALAGADVGADLRLTALGWDGTGALELAVTGRLVHRAAGRPWCYREEDDALCVPSPEGLERPLDPALARVDEAELASAQLRVVARRRRDSQEWTLPGRSSTELRREDGGAWLAHRAEARIDPLTIAGGGPLDPGEWDFYGRITQSGWEKEARLGATRDAGITDRARVALLSGRLYAAYWTQQHDNLSLHVVAGDSRVTRAVQADHAAVTVGGTRRRPTLSVRLPLVVPPGTTGSGRIEFARDGHDPVRRRAALTPVSDAAAVMTVDVPRLARGRWEIGFGLEVENWKANRATGAELVVGAFGRLAVQPAT